MSLVYALHTKTLVIARQAVWDQNSAVNALIVGSSCSIGCGVALLANGSVRTLETVAKTGSACVVVGLEVGLVGALPDAEVEAF